MLVKATINVHAHTYGAHNVNIGGSIIASFLAVW